MPIYASIVSPGYMPAVVETTADICGRNGLVVVGRHTCRLAVLTNAGYSVGPVLAIVEHV
jgi:hypothetical protein